MSQVEDRTPFELSAYIRAFDYFRQQAIFPNVGRRFGLFLTLAASSGQSIITGAYMKRFGMSSALATFYLSDMVALGFFEKVAYGKYKITPKALEAYQLFQDKLAELRATPFQWHQ